MSSHEECNRCGEWLQTICPTCEYQKDKQSTVSDRTIDILLKKNLELKEWKALATPFLEDEYNVIKQGLEAECREDAVHPSLRPEWEEMYKTLTKLLEK